MTDSDTSTATRPLPDPDTYCAVRLPKLGATFALVSLVRSGDRLNPRRDVVLNPITAERREDESDAAMLERIGAELLTKGYSRCGEWQQGSPVGADNDLPPTHGFFAPVARLTEHATDIQGGDR